MNALPLCCFAPVSWYVLYAEDNFALSNEEYFQKQTYRNRFDILTGNGVQTLTIPVESTGGERTLLRDIRISPEYSGKKTLQAIRSAYGNSAMYDFIDVELEELFLKEEKFLIDFNTRAHEYSIKWFGLLAKEKIAELYPPSPLCWYWNKEEHVAGAQPYAYGCVTVWHKWRFVCSDCRRWFEENRNHSFQYLKPNDSVDKM